MHRRPGLHSSLRSSFLAALSLAIAATIALAQDASTSSAKPPEAQSYRAGTKSIVIPPPEADLLEMGADYRVLAETFVPTSNRLVAAFLKPEDSAALRDGKSQPLSKYALLEIPRSAEFADITPNLYKQVADSVAKQFEGDLDATLKDQEEELNRRLKALNSSAGTMTFDKAAPLGTFFSKSDACAFGMLTPVAINGTSTKVAMGLIVVRVQNRVLFGYLYSTYKDEGSITWLRKTSEQWADAILKANISPAGL